MTLTSTLLLAATTYGVAAIISMLVAILIKGIHVAINLVDRPPRAVQVTRQGSAPVHADDANDIPPEVIAIITAAATTMLKQRIRIKTIRYRTVRPETMWEKQGRMTIMASHRTR